MVGDLDAALNVTKATHTTVINTVMFATAQALKLTHGKHLLEWATDIHAKVTKDTKVLTAELGPLEAMFNIKLKQLADRASEASGSSPASA
eukprot:3205689-Pyramimonas_sp.AAC.1